MEDELYQSIQRAIRTQLDLRRDLDDSEIEEIIDQQVLLGTKEVGMDTRERICISNKLFNSLRRLDALQNLIEDDSITEIMVNGNNNIFFEQKGLIRRADVKFESKEKLEDVIQNIVSKINRVVNQSSPICDARLSDGSRVNIVLTPIALDGPILTIRKFSKEVISMNKLIEWGTISEAAAEFLRKAVESKCNIFISGGTGSGKTTLLNILSNFIPRDERIITIEDSAELQIQNISNLVRLETKTANTEGRGMIGIRELIRTSLRMRPDRIIVGEVRGAEAIDMLQCMNTGHDGSCSTGHANSTRDMLSRLETMILTEENIPLEVIRRQISSSIDIMVHLGRVRDKSRKVIEIAELVGVEGGEYSLNQLFEYRESPVKGLYPTENRVLHEDKFIMSGFEI